MASLDGRKPRQRAPIGNLGPFDARAFDGWRDAKQPVLVHLHGSIRFGPQQQGLGLAKYSDAKSAGQRIEWTRTGDYYSAGQIVSGAPIISGLNKVAKLSHNPEPFGYYYRAFIDALLGSERLLVIGYGGRDDHVNTWLNQFKAKYSDSCRVAWIGKLTGNMVGEKTDEKQIISLLSGNKFVEYLHHDDPGSSERIFDCGSLQRVASGFPVSQATQDALIKFLRD